MNESGHVYLARALAQLKQATQNLTKVTEVSGADTRLQRMNHLISQMVNAIRHGKCYPTKDFAAAFDKEVVACERIANPEEGDE